MTTKRHKYVVSIEGLSNPMELDRLEDAFDTIRLAMPTSVTINAKEIDK